MSCYLKFSVTKEKLLNALNFLNWHLLLIFDDIIWDKEQMITKTYEYGETAYTIKPSHSNTFDMTIILRYVVTMG